MHKVMAVIVLVVCLNACAPVYTNITPEIREKMMADLKTGRLMLNDQSFSTDLQFTMKNSDLIKAHNSKNWAQLAELTMQIGHENDISYYYLGVSAENLGYLDAAILYYGRALVLYNDNISHHHCRESGNNCGGLNLGSFIPNEISHVKDMIAKQQIARASATRVDSGIEQKKAEKKKNKVASGKSNQTSSTAASNKSDGGNSKGETVSDKRTEPIKDGAVTRQKPSFF